MAISNGEIALAGAIYATLAGIVLTTALVLHLTSSMHVHDPLIEHKVALEPAWLADAIRVELKAAEGYSETAYRDGRQYAICWGHAKGVEAGERLTKSECETRLTMDIDNAVEDARVSVKRFDQLPVDVKWSLIEMAFVLGRTGLQRFPKMIGAVNDGDFTQAAKEVEDSLWYTRNPPRVERIAARMREEGRNQNAYLQAQQTRAN